MDCSPPGFSLHGDWTLQARILAWVAMPFSRGFSQPRVQTQSPALQVYSLPSELPGSWGIWFNFCFFKKDYSSSVLSSMATTSHMWLFRFNSVQFSHSVMSDYLRPHESQNARPPCPSPTPGVYSNSCPLSRWCHPAISSSVVPFSSCPESLPASGYFPNFKFTPLVILALQGAIELDLADIECFHL